MKFMMSKHQTRPLGLRVAGFSLVGLLRCRVAGVDFLQGAEPWIRVWGCRGLLRCFASKGSFLLGAY